MTYINQIFIKINVLYYIMKCVIETHYMAGLNPILAKLCYLLNVK